MILRCTAKARKVLATDALVDLPADDHDWYVNLIFLERRKCLMLTHAGTLFTALAVDIRKAAVTPAAQFICAVIRQELDAEGLAPNTFGDLDPGNVQMAKTASRSVLGCMNEMALYCRYAVLDAGGFAACDMVGLNRELRRTIHAPRGYRPAIDLVALQ